MEEGQGGEDDGERSSSHPLGVGEESKRLVKLGRGECFPANPGRGGGPHLPAQGTHGGGQVLRRVQRLLQSLVRHEVRDEAAAALQVVQLGVVQLSHKCGRECVGW